MLIYAIGFIQNVQLVCFAVVLGLMAVLDRKNLSYRWLALGYIVASVAALAGLGQHILPLGLAQPLCFLGAPAAYACFHSAIVHFVNRGSPTRWISLAMVVGSIPFYVAWSLAAAHGVVSALDRCATLQDFTLAVQTGLSAWLLVTSEDHDTVWPRRAMGVFFGVYAAVEAVRVGGYMATGHVPDLTAHWLEVTSGIVYVVSCSLLPVNFIWMSNARLHPQMERQMSTDPLTQLLNRRGLFTIGELEAASYQRYGREFAVAMLDIDHFKKLNDANGHAAGDRVLREAAHLLSQQIRKSDTMGRLGGEEFVILLPATGAAGAATLVENLRRTLEAKLFDLGRGQARITASFGVSLTSGRMGVTWEALLEEADQALYTAKRDGRNLCRFYVLPNEAKKSPSPRVGA